MCRLYTNCIWCTFFNVCFYYCTSSISHHYFDDQVKNKIFSFFSNLWRFVFSAFFWLLSLLVSSLLWFAVVPLRDELAFAVPFAVIFQEIFRYLFYRMIK